MRSEWPKLASLAQEICTLKFQFFCEFFVASKGYPFKNIFNKVHIWMHHYHPYHYKCSEIFTPYWRWLHNIKIKTVKYALACTIKQ